MTGFVLGLFFEVHLVGSRYSPGLNLPACRMGSRYVYLLVSYSTEQPET